MYTFSADVIIPIIVALTETAPAGAAPIGKEVNPDLVDQFKILKEEANPEFYKEVYIKCKKANSYE